MARVEVYPDRVVIRLTAAEKTLAVRRSDVVLDRASITSAVITDDPWVWLRGVRAPGAYLPRKLALGTWRALAGRDFVVARSGRPAVVIDLESPEAADEGGGWIAVPPNADDGTDDGVAFDRFARVIVSTRHAGELVQALRLDDTESVFTATD